MTEAEWDVRGWRRLTVHDDPPLLAARREVLAWLDEVPQSARRVLESRLQSDLDHPHLSARMELFLHNHFVSKSWPVSLEPEVPESPNKPDFLVAPAGMAFYVEAKLIQDAQAVSQQDQRLNQLADSLHNRLSRTVMLKPWSNLPPSLPGRRIASEIEKRAAALRDDRVVEFELSDVHLDQPFTLKVTLFPRTWDIGSGVGALSTGVRTVVAGADIRKALHEKSGKYGELGLPYVICLWPAEQFSSDPEHEYDALFGTRVWHIPPRGAGTVVEDRQRDGFFCMQKPGEPPHLNVSGVLFYRFRWLEDIHEHRLHIYHNPFAKYPLGSEAFRGIPQMVLEDDGNLRWIGGTPDQGMNP
jgi:hypothetical protein